uniref:Uncharacterized protein n=1 Tax=Astyanax mexicanus TaxID=7994 RepID=A0A8B9JGJ7_ASTMX
MSLCLQSSLLLKSRVCHRLPVSLRCYSSNDKEEQISRYPVPYRKSLPYDIVELMEEVETKAGLLFFLSIQLLKWVPGLILFCTCFIFIHQHKLPFNLSSPDLQPDKTCPLLYNVYMSYIANVPHYLYSLNVM